VVDSIVWEAGQQLKMLEHFEGNRALVEKKMHQVASGMTAYGALLTLPGIGPKLGPIILSFSWPIWRFANIRKYRGYVGYVPSSRQTGGKKAKCGRIKKAGPNLLKYALYLAARNAILNDPQLAEFAHRLYLKGKIYQQVVCAVANKLAGRVYAVLKRHWEKMVASETDEDSGYERRDLEGKAITKKEARALIQAKYRLKDGAETGKEQKSEGRLRGKAEGIPATPECKPPETTPDSDRSVQQDNPPQATQKRSTGQEGSEAEKRPLADEKKCGASESAIDRMLGWLPPPGSEPPGKGSSGEARRICAEAIAESNCSPSVRAVLQQRIELLQMGDSRSLWELLGRTGHKEVDENIVYAQLRVLDLRQRLGRPAGPPG
jgi:hypothetical protein